ncbi:MAG: tetratricopeptide repeat protein [Spirochaetia bacterium]
MHLFRLIVILLAGALVLAACETVPEPSEIPEDLTTQEYFQRAQEAMDDQHYETSMVYYETFLERHPDDTENRMAARYEIAFLHYKMGEYDTAEQQFEDILARYEESDEQLPEWVRVLSEKLIEKIEEIRTTDEEPVRPAGPAEPAEPAQPEPTQPQPGQPAQPE